MASATIATKYGTAPRSTWDGTEKIPLDVGGADGVGLASTLKTYMIGAGSVSVTTGKTLTVTNDVTIAATPAVLTANTFTATQTLNPAVNTEAIIVSGFSLTGSDTHQVLNLAGTWNVGTTVVTAIKLNMTDTASGLGSFLMDLQTSTVSKFSVSKTGAVVGAAGASFSGAVGGQGFTTGGVTIIENLNVPVTGVTYHGRDSSTGASGATFLRGGTPVATNTGGALTLSGGLGVGADQVGGLLTLNGGVSTGAGLGGDIVFQVTPASGSSSTANALGEVLRILSTGNIKFTGAGNFTANATTATTMTSLGPAGASTTIAEWLTIKNASGTTRYIPCY